MVHTNSVSNEISVLLAQASVLLEIVKPVDSDLDEPTIKSTLMEMLHTLRRRNELYQLYALLEQVALTEEEKSAILKRMTDAGHLHGNPLAPKLGMDEYKKQESDWISEQEKLRKYLLERLKGYPQFLYNQFDEISEAAKGLLFPSPPKKFPYKTKIGFEFEGVVREGERASLPLAFYLGRDTNGLSEIRLRGGGVPFDPKLQQEFVKLWYWIRHNFLPPKARRVSMHFHFDQNDHPRKPTLGGLFPDIRDNRLGTWEQRGFYPPESPDTLLAIIEASIRYSKMGDKEDAHIHNSSINIHDNYPERWQHLLWGMICAKIDDPHTRLCLLLALKDPHALIGFSEQDIYQTFGDELFSPHCNIEEIIPGLGVYKVAIQFLAAQADLPLDSRPDTVSLLFPSGHVVDSPEEIVTDTERIKKLTTELGQLRIDTDPEAMNSVRINRAIEIVIRGLSENYNVKLLGSLKLLFQKERVPQVLIDKVLRLLDKDKESYVRSAALGALQPLLERENLPDLLINRVQQMLDDEDSYVRSAALEALQPLLERENLPDWLINRVQQMLNDEDRYVRSAALEALQPLLEREKLPDWLINRVQQMLHDEDRYVRLVALGALQPLLERENLPDWLINRVQQMLHDEDRYVRLDALEALKPLFARENPPDWLINRVQQMLDGEDSYVRAVALKALKPLFARENLPGWLIDRVQQMLYDDEIHVHTAALEALQPLLERENLPDWLIDLVQQMLDDRESYVRAVALKALKSLFAQKNSPERLINRVQQMLDDEDSYVRLVALEALQPLLERENLPDWLIDRVQQMLYDREGYVRAVALKALKSLFAQKNPPERLINRVQQMLDDEDSYVRLVALEALEPLLERENLPDWLINRVQQMRYDEDISVRLVALRLLDNIQNRIR
jgi:HEAT repeat protein